MHRMENQTSAPNLPEQFKEKSWGDRFKHATFGVSIYAGLNGVFNLILSAVLAYFVELRYQDNIRRGATRLGNWVSTRIGGNAKRLGDAFYNGPMAVVLGGGGWMLLAPIKLLEDRRRRIEFRIGHMLDKMQEAFGRGNSASKDNLADYGKIRTAMDQKVEFTVDEKERLGKHRIDIGDDGRATFREHRLPWYKIVAARLTALVTTSYGPGALYGYIGLTGKLEAAGPKVTRSISKVFPWYTRVFKDPNLLSKNLAIDTLLTVTVAGAHKITQDILHHDPKETEERKQKIAKKDQSFSAREDAKAADLSLGAAV